MNAGVLPFLCPFALFGVSQLKLIGYTSDLVVETATMTGEVIMRNVCFSPDGKYLATGGGDMKVRVRIMILIASCLGIV